MGKERKIRPGDKAGPQSRARPKGRQKRTRGTQDPDTEPDHKIQEREQNKDKKNLKSG